MRILILTSLVGLSIILTSCGSSVAFFHPIVEFEAADAENVWIITDTRDLLHLNESGGVRKVLDGEAVAVDFVNDRTGWVVTESGGVLKTADGGANWHDAGVLSTNNLLLRSTEIDFVDETVGWISANWSVWRTVDGGASWKESNLSFIETYENEIYPPVPRSILAVSRDEFWCGSATGVIFRTFDGGRTWKTNTLPERENVSALRIDRSGRIWVGTWARGHLFVSDNHGVDWKEVEWSKTLGRIGISSIDFSNEGQGWILGGKFLSEPPYTRVGDFLNKTENFGATWEEARVDNFPFRAQRLEFVNSSVGYLVGYNEIAITRDAGASWKLIYSSGS